MAEERVEDESPAATAGFFTWLLPYFLFYSVAAVSIYVGVNLNNSSFEKHGDDKCELITRYDPNIGFGIFAGKHIKFSAQIEQSLAFFIPPESGLFNELSYYMNDFNETHAVVSAGFTMIYNYRNPKEDENSLNTVKALGPQNATWSFRDGSSPNMVVYYANKDIAEGEEILSDVEDDWFSQRNVKPVSRLLLRNSQVVPTCPYSNIKDLEEDFQVSAKRAIEKGSIIEITRALLLPAEDFEDVSAAAISELTWRSNSGNQRATQKDLVLLPLGFGVLYTPSADPDGANVEIFWADPKDATTPHVPRKSAGECRSRMIIGFRAKRRIYANEKLKIALSVDPETGHRSIVQPDFSTDCFSVEGAKLRDFRVPKR